MKPRLKNCMCTSTFDYIFVELIVNDKEQFRRYLKINTAHSIRIIISFLLDRIIGCLILRKSSQTEINSMMSL